MALNLNAAKKSNSMFKKELRGHSSDIHALTILNNGDIVSASLDKSIKIWNANTGDLKKTLEGHKDCIQALIVLANGNLASGSWDKTIRIWDVDTGEIRKVLAEHMNRVILIKHQN